MGMRINDCMIYRHVSLSNILGNTLIHFIAYVQGDYQLRAR